MQDNQLEKQNFEKKKAELQRFAKGKQANSDLPRFEEKTLGIFEKKVSATEMNKFISILQSYFIVFSEADRKIIKEFQQVYDTFDALDQEYINGIVGNIKALEEVSNSNQEKFEEAAKLVSFLKKKLNDQGKLVKQVLENDHEQDQELERQAAKDEEHDEAIKKRIEKDKAQDRELRAQKKKDLEHDEAIAAGIEKDKEQDSILEEQRLLNENQENQLIMLKKEVNSLKKELSSINRKSRRLHHKRPRHYRQ